MPANNFSRIVFILWMLSNCSAYHFRDVVRHDSMTAYNKACPALNAFVKYMPFYRPHIENLRFQLRTPCVNVYVPVDEADTLVEVPEFDANKETVVLITGWRSGLGRRYIENLAQAYYCRGGYNFLVFDTASYIEAGYIKSASNTERLGEFLTVGLQKLGVSPQRIHLIGHSLGAHIAGRAGQSFYYETGQKLKRITGLDPARPCFKTPSVFPALDRSDADYVDIIHSNPGILGMEDTEGDADFYPDGLVGNKPGCEHSRMGCSHIMSLDYFTESVLPGNEYNLMSKHCASYSHMKTHNCTGPQMPMGFAANDSVKGVLYLPVNDKSPYGVNATKNFALKLRECGRCREDDWWDNFDFNNDIYKF